MRTPVLFSTLLMAACGGGGGDGPSTVTLDTIGPADLVAVKLGTGDWQVLETDGTVYEIEVDEPYVVAVACNDVAGLFDTYLFARVPEDEGGIEAPCTGEAAPLDGAVQGELVQAGEVAIGFTSQSVGVGGLQTFDLPASLGAHEVVAISDTSIAIRDVDVTGVTQLPAPIDIDAQGLALVPAGFTVTNAAPDESPFAFARLFTEHDTFVAIGFGDPDTVLVAPDGILGIEDSQSFSVSASRGELSRSVFVPEIRDAAERSLTLPEYLDGVALSETGGTIAAEWGDLPEHDSLELSIDQDAAGAFLFHILTISPAYADAMGTSIALDLAIPGFDPAGEVDVTAAYNRSFAAVRGTDQRATSTVAEAVNQPPQQKRTRRAFAKPAIGDRVLTRR